MLTDCSNAAAASSGFVNLVTCLTAKIVDASIDSRYHRGPGDGMPENIQPRAFKTAFLQILDLVEERDVARYPAKA